MGDDIFLKKKAAWALPKIAKEFGDRKVRKELIPFIINELTNNDNEQIISILI